MATATTEDATLWKAYHASRSTDARNRLIERYLPIVRYQANRVWAKLPEGVELDDLVSSGVFGLMDAIDAFDLSRGVKFETYCVPRIRGAMIDELRKLDWVPRLVRVKASKLNEATKVLDAKLGRQPTEIELAEQLGVSVPELERMILDANATGTMSLNKAWYDTDSHKEVRQGDILKDAKAAPPSHEMVKADLLRLVTKGLNRNERLIVILYYHEELTMKEIGKTIGLSESRVSQIHTAVLRRIEKRLEGRQGEFGG